MLKRQNPESADANRTPVHLTNVQVQNPRPGDDDTIVATHWVDSRDLRDQPGGDLRVEAVR